jgi:Na+/H+ antiporter NhaD/arsenite permease-like protein
LNIFLVAVVFIVGIVITAAAFLYAWRVANARQKKRKIQHGQPPANKRKIEFSKLVLTLVLLTYFAGVGVGVRIVFIDYTQLGVVLAFIGTPTAAAIGFYAWKAKAENTIKIKKENPKETEGVPVDLNNIIT